MGKWRKMSILFDTIAQTASLLAYTPPRMCLTSRRRDDRLISTLASALNVQASNTATLGSACHHCGLVDTLYRAVFSTRVIGDSEQTVISRRPYLEFILQHEALKRIDFVSYRRNFLGIGRMYCFY